MNEVEKIKKEEKDSKIIFIGTTRGLENDLVPRAGYKLKTIEAYGLSKKISIDNMKEVSGQLVTPQNTLTIPHAAHKPIGSPNTGAKKLPRVAPTKSVGTISPPLNPPPNVMAVNSIFKIKTYHEQLVIKLAAIIGAPAPR